MQAGTKPLEMIAPVAVGDGIGPVLQHDANAANSGGFSGIGFAAAIGDPADKGEPFGNAVAFDPNHRIGSRAGGAAIVTGRSAIDRIAWPGVLAHFHNIGQQGAAGRGQGRCVDAEIAAIGGDGRRDRGAIIADGAAFEAHGGWQLVGYRNLAGVAHRIGVLHRYPILNGIAEGRAGRGRGLGDGERRSGPVERHIDAHRGGIVQYDDAPVGPVDNGKGKSVGPAQGSDLLGRGSRGEPIGFRRLDLQAIAAWPREREAVEAVPEIIDGAAAVGHAAACDHRAGIGGNSVVTKHLGRQAGVCIDQGDAGSGNQAAVLAVENLAKGIDEDVDLGNADGIAFDFTDRDIEFLTAFDREDTIALHGYRGHRCRVDDANEPAAVDRGFGDIDLLEVAGGGADGQVHAVDCPRIQIAVGGEDRDDQRFAGPDMIGRRDRGRTGLHVRKGTAEQDRNIALEAAAHRVGDRQLFGSCRDREVENLDLQRQRR